MTSLGGLSSLADGDVTSFINALVPGAQIANAMKHHQPLPNVQSQQQETAPQSFTSGGSISISIGTVAVVALGVGGYFLYRHMRKKK